MGRQLKRVPLDFNHPIGEVWEGYCPTLEKFQSIKEIVEQVPEILDYKDNICNECDKKFNDCDEDARYCIWYNPELRKYWYYEIPKGEGYQLWENTSEGSPISPVFATLEELCEYAEVNCSIFASIKISKGEWMQKLNEDYISHQVGNIIFV